VTVCSLYSDWARSQFATAQVARTTRQQVPRLEGALVDFSSGDLGVVTMYASCAYFHRSTLPSEAMTRNPLSTG